MQQQLADHLAAVGFDEYQALRDQLLDILSDEDLGTGLGGATLTLGALCASMCEIERAYIESFRTFRMDYEYRQRDERMPRSVSSLRSWYAELDRDLMAALDALTDEDTNRRIIRSDFDPDEYSPRPVGQLNNYREA